VKEPFILTAGRVWDEGKNVGALAAIATSLDWPIFVAGEGKHPDRGAVAHEGLHQLGRLPGRELAAWLGRAAVFALPARYEPFGFTPLEAALAGCALVLGDIPSLREVWGDAAVFVPPDDPEALRSALQRLIADDAARTALAGRAHVRALRFTPQRMAAGYLAAYRSLLADRSRPARGTLACAS
jgi:glycogen(starch) synthase